MKVGPRLKKPSGLRESLRYAIHSKEMMLDLEFEDDYSNFVDRAKLTECIDRILDHPLALMTEDDHTLVPWDKLIVYADGGGSHLSRRRSHRRR